MLSVTPPLSQVHQQPNETEQSNSEKNVGEHHAEERGLIESDRHHHAQEKRGYEQGAFALGVSEKLLQK